MKADKRGIYITKAEVLALCEFAGRDKERPTMFAVHFRVEGEELAAYASDGRRALECSAVAGKGAFPGEWSLGREFAVELGRLLTGTEHAVLQFAGTVQATVEDEDGNEGSTLVWPSDGASTQLSLPTSRAAITPPAAAKRVACMTLPATQLAAVGLVGKAAAWNVVDVYAPKNRTDPIVFRVTGRDSTWTGCIMPTRGDEETEDDKPERGVREAVDKFRDAIPEGTTATLSSGGKSVTLKSKGRKSAEATAE